MQLVAMQCSAQSRRCLAAGDGAEHRYREEARVRHRAWRRMQVVRKCRNYRCAFCKDGRSRYIVAGDIVEEAVYVHTVTLPRRVAECSRLVDSESGGIWLAALCQQGLRGAWGSSAQGGDEAPWLEQEIECRERVGREHLGGGQKCGAGAFGAEHRNAERRGTQHLAVVATVPDGDRALRAESLYMVAFCPCLVVRFQNAQLYRLRGKGGGGSAVSISGNDVDTQDPGETVQAFRHSVKQVSVDGERSIEIKHHIRQHEACAPGNIDA